jgi:hypothetical protein
MTNFKKQLGIQILEYSLLGALIIGGGAAAVMSLSNSTKNSLNAVATCVQSPSVTNSCK